jgi:hypothetical protein
MVKRPPALVLEPKGDGFVLRRTDAAGKSRSLTLSDNDVLQLAQAALSLRGHILAKRSPAGGSHPAVMATSVARLRLGVDALAEDVLLTLIAPSGVPVGFALSDEVAQLLVDHLPTEIAKLRAAKTKTRQ